MMRRNRERGGTLVEGAFVILLLFTLLFATIEFGRAYNIYQVLTNAAREGARHSVAPFPGTSTLPGPAEVEARVREFLDSAAVTGATVAVDQGTTSTINGVQTVFTDVQVTAPYTFAFFPFGTVNMQTRVVMRNETN